MFDSPWLVDFTVGQVDSVLYLLDRLAKVFGGLYCERNSNHSSTAERDYYFYKLGRIFLDGGRG